MGSVSCAYQLGQLNSEAQQISGKLTDIYNSKSHLDTQIASLNEATMTLDPESDQAIALRTQVKEYQAIANKMDLQKGQLERRLQIVNSRLEGLNRDYQHAIEKEYRMAV